MRKMMRTIMFVLAAVLVAALTVPALAQGGPWGMRAPRPAFAAPSGAPALPIDQAITRARQYLGQFQNPDLVPGEIIEFSNVFYVLIQEKGTGKGAFALLVDRVNGNVSPEMGPPMMWNTKYGRRVGDVGMMGPGMMGPGFGPGGMGSGIRGSGMGPGMMGPGYGSGYGPGNQSAPRGQGARPQAGLLDEPKAKAAAQAWVNQAFPGAVIGKVVEFPGFYTYRLIRDGKTFALASVHAYGGQVWYGWHYGTFVKEQVVR
jgi:hypothetical protein